jgi:tryptophan-rich sensory protein
MEGDPWPRGMVGVLSRTHTSGSLGQLLILVLFGINIVLHMLWCPLFFNLKRPTGP